LPEVANSTISGERGRGRGGEKKERKKDKIGLRNSFEDRKYSDVCASLLTQFEPYPHPGGKGGGQGEWGKKRTSNLLMGAERGGGKKKKGKGERREELR